MQSIAALEQLFAGPIVSEKPRIIDSEQPFEEIFNAEYARTYDSDMVEALPDLHRAWMRGTEIAASITEGDSSLVLDEGVGTGRVTEAILRRNPSARVIGLDRSRAFLTVGQERLAKVSGAAERSILKVGDLSKPLPFENSMFDAIVSHWVVQYLSRASQRQLYRENCRMLKPGGKFFLNVSTMPFKAFVPIFVIIYKVRGVWDKRYSEGIARIWKHLPVVKKFNEGYKTGAMYLPKLDEAEAMLREAGFSQVEVVEKANLPTPFNWKSFVAYIVATK
jgi:ubiquinone/menaquinone biosynthesis C-methylase UbiE